MRGEVAQRSSRRRRAAFVVVFVGHSFVACFQFNPSEKHVLQHPSLRVAASQALSAPSLM
jgi:hypothetical protein